MGQKKRRYSKGTTSHRYTRHNKSGTYTKLLFVCLLMVFCVVLKSVDQGPLLSFFENVKEVFAVHLDASKAIETLGQSFSKGNAENENALMVFGRMILGLEETEEATENERSGEEPIVDYVQTDEIATDEVLVFRTSESPEPLLDPAELANALSVAEIDDSTVNAAFQIPSPDIVDDAVYTLSGTLSMPLSAYRVTSRFGYRIHPISGNTTFHYGADLAASTGTPVVSVADGKISETGYGSINGNYVKITHADGYISHYTHLQTINVRKGETVVQGKQIGTVGSTGYSTGPHLHFELRRNGKILDPFKYFTF